MRPLITIFLSGFLLDAVLQLCAPLVPLAPLRGVVEWTVFALGLAIYAGMAFVPRIPKRLLLPAIAFLVWADVCGGFPMAFIAPESAGSFLAWSEAILAMTLLTFHLCGNRWQSLRSAGFAWKNLAVFTIFTALAVPLVAVIATVNLAGTRLEKMTGGYVKLRPAGLMLEERDFEKDGRKVRLVSMMHIGNQDFYEKIHDSLPSDSASAVLLEGVTDKSRLLTGRFSYVRVAAMLGLSAQESSALQREKPSHSRAVDGPTHIDYRRADVDVGSFTPLTINFINAIGVLMASPTIDAAMQALRNPVFNQTGVSEVVQADILDKRNNHLKGQIDDALREYGTVVVPWGAMHLQFIEDSLRKQGFRETQRVSRPVIRF